MKFVSMIEMAAAMLPKEARGLKSKKRCLLDIGGKKKKSKKHKKHKKAK